MGIRCDDSVKKIKKSRVGFSFYPRRSTRLFHGRNTFRLFLGERIKGLLTSSCILIDSDLHLSYYSTGNTSTLFNN